MRAAVQPYQIIFVVLDRQNYLKLRKLEFTDQFLQEFDEFADKIHIVKFDDFIVDQTLLAHKKLKLESKKVLTNYIGQANGPKAIECEELKLMIARLARPTADDLLPYREISAQVTQACEFKKEDPNQFYEFDKKDLDSLLGFGDYGDVYKAKRKLDNKMFAIKISHKEKDGTKFK